MKRVSVPKTAVVLRRMSWFLKCQDATGHHDPGPMVNFWAVRRSIAATRLVTSARSCTTTRSNPFSIDSVGCWWAQLFSIHLCGQSRGLTQLPSDEILGWEPAFSYFLLCREVEYDMKLLQHLRQAVCGAACAILVDGIPKLGLRRPTWISQLLPAEAPLCNRSNEMHLRGALRRESKAPCNLCGFFSPDGSRRLGKSFDGSRLGVSRDWRRAAGWPCQMDPFAGYIRETREALGSNPIG